MARCPACDWEGYPPLGRCGNCGAAIDGQPAPQATPQPTGQLRELDPAVDLTAVERALRSLLLAAGEDPESLPDSPRRAVQALLSLTAGSELDPAECLDGKLWPTGGPGAPPQATTGPQSPAATHPAPPRATLAADVPVRMACERCMLPVFGAVHLRCQPGSKTLDGSHLAKLTRCLAARLQSEPQLAEQLAAALVDLGGASWASVRVSARRPCDDCGAGQARTTARARRTAPAGGDPPPQGEQVE